MANTTSGTVTFDKTFAVDDLIAEAYERIGSQVTSGYQLKTARRSLNIMFQEWGNRGLHYWEIAETNIDLIEGQAEYTFYRESGDGTNNTFVPASANDVITMNGSTKGGIAGSIITITAIDTATYMVSDALLIGSGTIVTPFADA